VAGCCECGDEPSGSCAMELVSLTNMQYTRTLQFEYNHQTGHRVRKLSVNTGTGVYNHNQLHLCNMGKRARLSVGEKRKPCMPIKNKSSCKPTKYCQLFELTE
jgi:hypothetical protein